MMSAKHSRLAASKTKQWATCSGSTAWLEAHPELVGGSGVHAQLGTAGHALGERCLREGSEPSDYEGRLIEVIEKEGSEGTSILKKNAKWPKSTTRVIFEVDVDMYEAVECFTNYVRHRVFELGLTSGDPAELALQTADLVKNGTVRLESRVTPLPERDDTGGTGDVIIDAWPVLIEVVDYKHGSGVFVSVVKNMQLRSYGLGALHEAGSDDYETVKYTICQPRHINSPSDGIMSEETTPQELWEWKTWLSDRAICVDVARNAVEEGAGLDELYEQGLLSVGEDGSHCTFCEVGPNCPAALAKAEELAMTDFDDEPGDIEVATGDNHLAMILPWIPFLDKWLKATFMSAENLVLSGGRVNGQKIVRKKSSGRKWLEQRKIPSEEEGGEPTYEDVTEEDIVKKLVSRGAKKKDLYTKPKLLSGPQAEKLIPKEHRKELTDEFMYKPEGGLTMVPDDDPRDEVVVDPADDFADVED